MGPKEGAKSTTEAYDPSGSAMDQDIDAEGIKTSGNLAHKFSVPGDHSNSSKPPENLKGE